MNLITYSLLIVLDDEFIFNYTPTWLFRALSIKLPLEYLIEDEEEQDNKCIRWCGYLRTILSYSSLVI